MTGAARSSACVFCEARDGVDESLVVARGTLAYVILNRFPYNNGHLMVVPNRHIASLTEAAPDELSEMMQLAAHHRIVPAVRRVVGGRQVFDLVLQVA